MVLYIKYILKEMKETCDKTENIRRKIKEKETERKNVS